MAKQTFQSRTTRRILEVAPKLRFIAFYHKSEDRLNACMRAYGGRSFIYIFSSCYMGEEYILYVGKSKAQYSRCLMHSKKYAFDHIYLFECEPEWLAESEKAVIRELTPIFNRNDNPQAGRIRHLLDIDYDAVQDEENIQCYLRRYSNYKKRGLFGFALPVALYTALENEAKKQGCTCGELVCGILEQKILQNGKLDLDHIEDIRTNLVTTQTYGDSHACSREQVKQYLRQVVRMPGTVKVGKTWLIPYDMKFPENLRGKNRKI